MRYTSVTGYTRLRLPDCRLFCSSSTPLLPIVFNECHLRVRDDDICRGYHDINDCFSLMYAGNEHTVVLSCLGEVFTAGYNDNGQCGQGTTQRIGVLTRVPALVGKRAVQVKRRFSCNGLKITYLRQSVLKWLIQGDLRIVFLYPSFSWVFCLFSTLHSRCTRITDANIPSSC